MSKIKKEGKTWRVSEFHLLCLMTAAELRQSVSIVEKREKIM